MKKIICSILLLMTIFVLTSCNKEEETEHNYFEAEYILDTATSGDMDITDEYSNYTVTIRNNGTMRVFYNRNNTISELP